MLKMTLIFLLPGWFALPLFCFTKEMEHWHNSVHRVPDHVDIIHLNIKHNDMCTDFEETMSLMCFLIYCQIQNQIYLITLTSGIWFRSKMKKCLLKTYFDLCWVNLENNAFSSDGRNTWLEALFTKSCLDPELIHVWCWKIMQNKISSTNNVPHQDLDNL